MAAVAFTKVRAKPNRLVYTWTGDAAGDLAFATLLADAVAGPLKTQLAAVAGQCDSDAKATAALLTGASFTGAVSGAAIETNCRSSVVWQTGATAIPLLTAADDGAGNNPKLTITVAAAGTGILVVEFDHSLIR